MPVHLTISAEVMSLRADYLVRQTLVIAFIVIVRDEILNGCPQRLRPNLRNHDASPRPYRGRNLQPKFADKPVYPASSHA